MNKALVIKSLIYKTIERFLVKGLGFIISILMARLLTPEAFGQIAIVTVFVNLSQSIIEGGLGTALVQSREADADAGEDRSGTDGRGTGLYGVRRIPDLFVGNCLTDLTKV